MENAEIAEIAEDAPAAEGPAPGRPASAYSDFTYRHYFSLD